MTSKRIGSIQDWRIGDAEEEARLSPAQRAAWDVEASITDNNVSLDFIDPLNALDSAVNGSKSVMVEISAGLFAVYVAPLGGDNLVAVKVIDDVVHVEPNGPAIAVIEDGRIRLRPAGEVAMSHEPQADADPRFRLNRPEFEPSAGQRALLKHYPDIDLLALPDEPGAVDRTVNGLHGVGDGLFSFLWNELRECDNPYQAVGRAIEDLQALQARMPESQDEQEAEDDDASVTWEVLGYVDEAGYDAMASSVVEDDIVHRADAMRIGKEALAEFAVVKVQSSDREEIEVLRREPVAAAVREEVLVVSMTLPLPPGTAAGVAAIVEHLATALLPGGRKPGNVRAHLGPVPVVVNLTGGCIQGGFSTVPTTLVGIDYEGDPNDVQVVAVPQQDGTDEEAQAVSADLEVEPEHVARIIAAVAASRAGEDAKEG